MVFIDSNGFKDPGFNFFHGYGSVLVFQDLSDIYPWFIFPAYWFYRDCLLVKFSYIYAGQSVLVGKRKYFLEIKRLTVMDPWRLALYSL